MQRMLAAADELDGLPPPSHEKLLFFFFMQALLAECPPKRRARIIRRMHEIHDQWADLSSVRRLRSADHDAAFEREVKSARAWWVRVSPLLLTGGA